MSLRSEAGGAFERFRARLTELQPALARELEGVTKPEAAADMVKDFYHETIAQEVRQLEEGLKWSNIDAVTTTLAIPVSMSSALAVGLSAATGIPVIGAFAAGVVALGTVAAKLVGRRRQAQSTSAASYLVDIQHSMRRLPERSTYVCPDCGKSCVGPSGLEQHRRCKHATT
jgi:hypothetical protein